MKFIRDKINKIVKQIDRFSKISMKTDKINPFTNIQHSQTDKHS